MKNSKPLVAIIMGSDSDLPIMQEAAYILEEFAIPFEITIVSAHRTPDRMYSYAKSAEEKGIKVIIAGAGGAAHLPGMTASLTSLPVIGVPIKGKNLDGLDSLLSIVQMPPNIPVATMSINGARNAGLMAIKILASSDKKLLKKLDDFRESINSLITKKADKLEKIGYKKYLEIKK